jgi:hypothetical protein
MPNASGPLGPLAALDPTDANLAPGARRIASQLARIHDTLAIADQAHRKHTGSAALFGHAIYRAGTRTPAFMLQGLARIHEATDDAKSTFDALKKEAKILEDALGQVDFWWTMHEKSRGWGLPDEVRHYFRDRHVQAAGHAAGWAEARRWVDHRYMEDDGPSRLRSHKLAKRIAKVDFLDAKQEAHAIAAFLKTALKRAQEDASRLDLGDLEAGLHELRRDLRWFSIFAAALDGRIQLDGRADVPASWQRYLTPEVVQSPFNQLPRPSDRSKVVHLPASAYHVLSWLIAMLGDLKDRAQWTHTVEEALRITGSGAGRSAEAWLGADALSAEDAGRIALAACEPVVYRDRLLDHLADGIFVARP